MRIRVISGTRVIHRITLWPNLSSIIDSNEIGNIRLCQLFCAHLSLSILLSAAKCWQAIGINRNQRGQRCLAKVNRERERETDRQTDRQQTAAVRDHYNGHDEHGHKLTSKSCSSSSLESKLSLVSLHRLNTATSEQSSLPPLHYPFGLDLIVSSMC